MRVSGRPRVVEPSLTCPRLGYGGLTTQRPCPASRSGIDIIALAHVRTRSATVVCVDHCWGQSPVQAAIGRHDIERERQTDDKASPTGRCRHTAAPATVQIGSTGDRTTPRDEGESGWCFTRITSSDGVRDVAASEILPARRPRDIAQAASATADASRSNYSFENVTDTPASRGKGCLRTRASTGTRSSP